MRFISASYFQHLLNCLKTLGCHLTEHKATASPSTVTSNSQPGGSLADGCGINQATSNISGPQLGTPSTSTVKKTPARTRTTTKKKPQVPVLPALPLTAVI